MDPDIRKNLHKAAQKLGTPSPSTQATRLKSHIKKILLIGTATIGICVLLTYILLLRNEPKPLVSNSPIPTSISKATPFPIFYPDSKKMPRGYAFDVNSISASNQAVVYSVTYDNDKKIAFTIQKKPSENELKTFYANQLPLRHEIKLSIGKAAIGILNKQAMASIPSNKDSWLIVTAPTDIDQEKFKQVLQALQEE